MGTEVAIDASDMPAYANGQRFLYKDGPERQNLQRPRRLLGASQRRLYAEGGGFYGYRIHAAVCTKTGLPITWRVETARSPIAA